MTTFPTASDLELALQRLHILSGALPAQLTNLVDAAIQEWLHDTDVRYWLKTSRSDRFPIENGLIVPHSPIISLTSIVVAGATLIPDVDYVLHPLDVVPARYIVVNRWSGNAVVNAEFGWSPIDPVPADVWYAVLNKACLLAVSLLNTQSPGSVTRIRQGDVDVTYSDAETWSQSVAAQYNKVAMKYRLWRAI